MANGGIVLENLGFVVGTNHGRTPTAHQDPTHRRTASNNL